MGQVWDQLALHSGFGFEGKDFCDVVEATASRDWACTYKWCRALGTSDPGGSFGYSDTLGLL